MNREDALELIERMPYIRTIQVPNDRVRLEFYNTSVQSADPVEWIKVVKNHHIRTHDKALKRFPSEAEAECAQKAKAKLHTHLAQALSMEPDQMEDYIIDYISTNQ